MKKLNIDYTWRGSLVANDKMESKINEIVDFLNSLSAMQIYESQPKKEELSKYNDDICRWGKKLEVKHGYGGISEKEMERVIDLNGLTFHYSGLNFCYTDKENEAIKIALRYANHRYTKHGKDFMPKKFRPLFEEVIKKL